MALAGVWVHQSLFVQALGLVSLVVQEERSKSLASLLAKGKSKREHSLLAHSC
jgi:hypothetical protein